MTYLPLANVLHHKLRSVLSALGIAIGVCMLIVLAGLSRGSLNEVLRRWDGVDAELIVHPAGVSLTMAYGACINLKAADAIMELRDQDGGPLAERVTPAILARPNIAGREHNVFGIRAEDFPVFSGGGEVIEGRLPDPDGAFAAWIDGRFDQAAETGELLSIADEELADNGGLEMAIDTKLARMLGKGVGDSFHADGCEWRIVGIFKAGAIARAFAPMAAVQYRNSGRLNRVTMLFVKLPPGAVPGKAADAIKARIIQKVVHKSAYSETLMETFDVMFIYVDAVNIIALLIAFLFVMVTLYTMVLQRTREIAILKSMGAGPWFLLRQVLAESMLLTGAGAAIGVGLSFAAGAGIEQFRPDLTVSITARWIGYAILAAATGGVLAGLYPAWRAARIDVAENLTQE